MADYVFGQLAADAAQGPSPGTVAASRPSKKKGRASAGGSRAVQQQPTAPLPWWSELVAGGLVLVASFASYEEDLFLGLPAGGESGDGGCGVGGGAIAGAPAAQLPPAVTSRGVLHALHATLARAVLGAASLKEATRAAAAPRDISSLSGVVATNAATASAAAAVIVDGSNWLDRLRDFAAGVLSERDLNVAKAAAASEAATQAARAANQAESRRQAAAWAEVVGATPLPDLGAPAGGSTTAGPNVDTRANHGADTEAMASPEGAMGLDEPPAALASGAAVIAAAAANVASVPGPFEDNSELLRGTGGGAPEGTVEAKGGSGPAAPDGVGALAGKRRREGDESIM